MRGGLKKGMKEENIADRQDRKTPWLFVVVYGLLIVATIAEVIENL